MIGLGRSIFHYIYSFLTYEQELYTTIIVFRMVLCICNLLTDIKWRQINQQILYNVAISKTADTIILTLLFVFFF
jgi:hypothetical protein